MDQQTIIMIVSMRSRVALLVIALCACAGDDSSTTPRTLKFGPFDLAPGQEISDQCVQITLNNTTDLYINSVELTTGPGFHHSNWFFVPERTFAGEDGTYTCKDRDFSEAVAAVFGGVLFAQSTQSPHEIQQFPDGVIIKVPAKSKIVSQIHLLNPTDGPLDIKPEIRLVPIAESAVTTTLAGVMLENHAIALPPSMQSKFTVDGCDIATRHEALFGREPDFKIYYALAHYHKLGTALSIEAVKADGTASLIYSTESRVGDTLGGPIDPAFDMTGYTKLRFSCSYYNPTQSTVRWGIGDQEMCVFLAFSDSTYNWAGGVLDEDPPGSPVQVGNEMQFTNPCTVYANDATH
jgi:hypothetical protein